MIERARQASFRQRLLKRRASASTQRPPLIVVPALFGTRLVDGRGRTIWGATRSVFFGPPIGGATDVRPSGLLEELPIVPGLVGQDIHGGLLRFLTEVGGYRRGEDLFALEYDWRTGIIDAAARLDELVRSIRGVGEERVDLLCISSGGAIARYYMAYGGADVLGSARAGEHEGERVGEHEGERVGERAVERVGEAGPIPRGGASNVRRVIYVGSPQRGTFGAPAHLYEGIVFIPGGKHFRPSELALCQTSFDYMPHPTDPVFVDERGRTLDYNLYDPEVWSKLGIAGGLKGIDVRDFGDRLTRARRLHDAFDRAPEAHPDTFVIGGRHLPTRARFLVARGRAILPPCDPDPNDPTICFTYTPGDSALPEASLMAVPGLEEDRLWLVTPKAHHLIPADPDVHRLVLEALLATERRIGTVPLRVRLPESLVRLRTTP
jgi:hypothetical protein